MPKTRSVRTPRCILIAVLCCVLGGGLLMTPAASVSAASLHVTSCLDDGGTGTLRTRIGSAALGSTIDFSQDCTGATAITLALARGTLTLTQNVTIDGTGHTVIVDGNNNGSVFTVNSGVTASINLLTIQHGNAANGGGINNSGTLTVTNSTLSGNSASNFGGALENAGTVTVTGSTLSGNNSGGSGGGIDNSLGTLTVTNSTLSGNAARFGGGISTFCGLNSCTGSTTVTSSTFSGNTASVDGGGIRISSGGMTLTNTIIANSTAGGDCNYVFGTLTADSHNVADDGSCAGATQKTSAEIALMPLGSYGGPTQTMALGPGSAAIDQGATVGSGPAGPNPPANTVPALDQRGKSRIGTPDIGAFESQGFTLARTSGDGQTTGVNQPFASPLVVTLSETGGSPLPGGTVTFTAPGTGASATFDTPNPATTDANGQASVTATANGTPGAYTVTAGAPGASPVTFTLTNITDLSGISPASGSTTGGNTVTLTGGGFGTSATTHVFLDGVALPATSITSVTGTQITYVAPAHAAGSVVVTVTVGRTPLAGSVTYTYGLVNALPSPSPPGPVGSPTAPLPGLRPTGTTGGPAPNPLPAARP